MIKRQHVIACGGVFVSSKLFVLHKMLQKIFEKAHFRYYRIILYGAVAANKLELFLGQN